jgi:hypothetical protein
MRGWPLFLLGGVAILVVAFSVWAALYSAIHDHAAQTLIWGAGGVLGGLLLYEVAESRATGK